MQIESNAHAVATAERRAMMLARAFAGDAGAVDRRRRLSARAQTSYGARGRGRAAIVVTVRVTRSNASASHSSSSRGGDARGARDGAREGRAGAGRDRWRATTRAVSEPKTTDTTSGGDEAVEPEDEDASDSMTTTASLTMDVIDLKAYDGDVCEVEGAEYDDSRLDAFPEDFPCDGEQTAAADRGRRVFRNEAEKRAAWSLGLLTVAYCHASATGFLLPSLLPAMSSELHLSDGQGALLTTLFTVTYSLLLPFVGALADTVNRKNLLASGAVIWTTATFLTAHATNYSGLLLSRGLFAVGNGAQNPVAFSMIPELFPRNKALALSVYNLAIHAGRAVSFASGAFVGRAPLPTGAEEHIFSNEPLTLPLTYLTEIGALGAHTILYTTADSVVLTPNVGTVLENSVADAMLSTGLTWQNIYDVVAVPGILIAPLIFFTVSDPGRKWTGSRALRRKLRADSRAISAESTLVAEDVPTTIDSEGLVALISSFDESDMEDDGKRLLSVTRAVVTQGNLKGQFTSIPLKARGRGEILDSLLTCFESKAFRDVTLAATLTDIAGWSMIAFQAAFYERTFALSPQEYDPLLAFVIPIAGVTGGLGGGWICDKLQLRSPQGQRWFISAMTVLAGPLLAASLLAEDYKTSLMFLFPGMVAAEIFRSPTAVMTRDAKPDSPSVAAAAHLAVRNLVAGCGPLSVAFLAKEFDLQHAMLLAPVCYVLAGFAYFNAIGVLTEERAERMRAKMTS